MADNWITLADAFTRMFACEKDAELVERVLLPALWEGKVSAIGRRAFVEGVLQNNIPVPKKTDRNGWPDENPVYFDWANSRAVSPRGIYRISRFAESIKYPRVEFYRVELSCDELHQFWPDLNTFRPAAESSVQTVSGFPGRPTSKHIIAKELERRADAGERHKSKTEWGRVLHSWLVEQYGNDLPNASAATIVNAFRGRLDDLCSAADRKPTK